jgi:hypothetical protein
MTLHIQAATDVDEESRAAALSFWEVLHSYSIRNPDFRASKRPVTVPADAPEIVREMAAAGRAGWDPCSRSRSRDRSSAGSAGRGTGDRELRRATSSSRAAGKLWSSPARSSVAVVVPANGKVGISMASGAIGAAADRRAGRAGRAACAGGAAAGVRDL